MVKKSKGTRARTRKLFKRGIKEKSPISARLDDFKINEKIYIKIDSSFHHGMPHPRFNGKIGKVISKRGRAFVIEINDMGKKKRIITFPENIRKIS